MVQSKKIRACVWSAPLLLLSLLLMACNIQYGTNPLGYSYVYDLMSSPTAHGTITFPTVTPQKTIDPLLREAGIGNTLDTFFHKLTPLSVSRPPSHYVFQQTLDAWPGGSILNVEFEEGNQDQVPRAIQVSLVPGTSHPTTYEEAEAWAQSLLPADRTGPTTVQGLDTSKGKCLSWVWNSPDLAKIFPVYDFIGNLSGKLAKPGDVMVTFVPHLEYKSSYPDEPVEEAFTNDNVIDNPNLVGSVLITLGDRPTC